MPLPASPYRRALVFSAVIACGAGCNAILGNEPAHLDGTAADDAPDGDRGPLPQGDAAPATPVAAAGPSADAGATDAALEAGCAPGSKTCGAFCVPVDDPFFGCASASCTRCELPHATAACASGACAVSACEPSFADCNRQPGDGCETDLTALTSCGACGIACPVLPHVVTSCVGGSCAGVCEVGFGDCNGEPADGCETDLSTERNHCGTCRLWCVLGRCELGVCVWP